MDDRGDESEEVDAHGAKQKLEVYVAGEVVVEIAQKHTIIVKIEGSLIWSPVFVMKTWLY